MYTKCDLCSLSRKFCGSWFPYLETPCCTGWMENPYSMDVSMHTREKTHVVGYQCAHIFSWVLVSFLFLDDILFTDLHQWIKRLELFQYFHFSHQWVYLETMKSGKLSTSVRPLESKRKTNRQWVVSKQLNKLRTSATLQLNPLKTRIEVV